MADVKVPGIENLYRRGQQYVGRVNYRDRFGRRREARELLGTADKSEAKALLGQLQKRYAVDHEQRVPRRGQVTVEKFLAAYMAYKKTEIDLGRFAETTWHRYQRDILGKVNPTIGQVPVLAVTKELGEQFLLEMRQNGRDPRSGGRERGHAPEVYTLISKMRSVDPPHSYADIAALLAHRFPQEAGITRDAVAGIWARMADEPSSVTSELEIATVRNMKEMLQGAWHWGVDASPPYVDRNVWKVARTPISKDPKNLAEVWTPAQLADFLAWAKAGSVRNWPAWQLAAALGARRAGVAGVRWHDVDFDAGTVTIRIFVKELGDAKHRILVEYHGKTSAHDGAKSYYLDRHTLATLAAHRATTDGYLRAARANVHTCPSVAPYCALPGYHNRGLLFPAAGRQGKAGGDYLHPREFLRQLQRAIGRYNQQHADQPLPMITVHGLRHGWNSVATDVGVNQAVRMERMDHTSAQTNDAYTQAFEASKRTAQDLVGEALFGTMTAAE